jgi:hypothetical protein
MNDLLLAVLLPFARPVHWHESFGFPLKQYPSRLRLISCEWIERLTLGVCLLPNSTLSCESWRTLSFDFNVKLLMFPEDYNSLYIWQVVSRLVTVPNAVMDNFTKLAVESIRQVSWFQTQIWFVFSWSYDSWLIHGWTFLVTILSCLFQRLRGISRFIKVDLVKLLLQWPTWTNELFFSQWCPELRLNRQMFYYLTWSLESIHTILFAYMHNVLVNTQLYLSEPANRM